MCNPGVDAFGQCLDRRMVMIGPQNWSPRCAAPPPPWRHTIARYAEDAIGEAPVSKYHNYPLELHVSDCHLWVEMDFSTTIGIQTGYTKPLQKYIARKSRLQAMHKPACISRYTIHSMQANDQGIYTQQALNYTHAGSRSARPPRWIALSELGPPPARSADQFLIGPHPG